MIVEACRHVGGCHGSADATDGRQAADPQVMRIAGVAADVGLVDVVSEHGIEGRDIAGHARHETRQQRGNAHAQHALWKIVRQHHGHGHIVVQ
jgi:hypothetical protein